MKKGFSIAEFTITMAVIGFLALFLIPTFIKSQQDKDIAARLEKMYSSLSQAAAKAEAENGSFNGWSLGEGASEKTVYETYFKPNLKIDKTCYETDECWKSTYDFYGDAEVPDTNKYGMKNGGILSFIMPDGGTVTMTKTGSVDEKFGVTEKLSTVHDSLIFMVDVNGTSAPNRLGRDVFALVFTDGGIIPAGNDNGSENCYKGAGSMTGYWDCSAKVLKDSKRDYI